MPSQSNSQQFHHQATITSPSLESFSTTSTQQSQSSKWAAGTMTNVDKKHVGGGGGGGESSASPNIRVMLTGIVPTCLLGKSLTINLLNGATSHSTHHTSKDLIAKYLNETTVKHFKLEILQNLLEQAEKDFGGIEHGAKYSSVSTFISHAKLLDFKLIKMGFLMENERSLNYYVKYQSSSNITDSMTIISLHAVFQDYNDLMIMVEEKLQHELHNTQESLYNESFIGEKRGGLLDGEPRESIEIDQSLRDNTSTQRGCCTIL